MFGFKKLNRCDVYLALNLLYSMQGLLYPSGAFNQMLQLIIIIWGLLVFMRYIAVPARQTKFLKATSVLVFMYCLYGGILIVFGNPLLEHIPNLPAKYIYLQSSLRSLLRIYVFFQYASVGYITASRIRVYAMVLLLSLIPQFYYQQDQIMLASDREEVTNNMGYTFLSIIPLLFFFTTKPLVQYSLLAITMLYIIISMKRGAIVIGSLTVIALIWSNLFSKDSKHKIWSLLFAVVLVVATVVVVSNMMAEGGYFAYRVEQTLSGDTSGRDEIYETLWAGIIEEPNLFYMLFGRGGNGTWAVAGDFAHQDWLETLCNNGLVGGLILLGFYYRLLMDAFSSKSLFSKNYFIAYLVLFFIAFSKTLFSMSIQSMEVSLSLLLVFFNFKLNQLNKCRLYKKA